MLESEHVHTRHSLSMGIVFPQLYFRKNHSKTEMAEVENKRLFDLRHFEMIVNCKETYVWLWYLKFKALGSESENEK